MKFVRFVFCAIPGALLMLIIGPGLIAPAIGHDLWPRPVRIACGIAALIAGGALVLYGVDRWRQWLYVIPIAAIVPLLLAWDADVNAAVLFVLLALPFVTAAVIHRHYANKSAP
jgi:hypothetical protein